MDNGLAAAGPGAQRSLSAPSNKLEFDAWLVAEVGKTWLEADADVLIMHADVTPPTLEHIQAGNIHMSLNPNQGVQGFMGFIAVHLANRSEIFDPFNDWKTSGFNPMQIPFMDNGFAVITKDNADSFDLNVYMKGRDPS